MAERQRARRAVLNADDPLVADLGRGHERATYFGVEDDDQQLSDLQHAADSKRCRNCGATYAYDAVYLGHLGRYCVPALRARRARDRRSRASAWCCAACRARGSR